MTRALAIALAITGCGGSSDSRPSLDPPIAARPAPIAGAVPTAPTAPTPDRQKKGAPPADTCYVDFLDIGTGLAVLVRCKDASSHELNLLYDGGSNDPALRSKNRLVYLLENGLDFKPGATIHHLFQSHPHFDHHSELIRAGGVIARYDVQNVWDPAAINETVAYGCFLNSVVEKANAANLVYHPANACPDFTKLKCDRRAIPAWRTPATSVKPFTAPSRAAPMAAALDIDLGVPGLTAKILHADSTTKHPNDASLILKLDLFGAKLLLTGDEEAGRGRQLPTVPARASSVEQFLLDSMADLSANIVSVPHHGSQTSSTDAFQRATIALYRKNPDTYAVISSGPKAYSGTQLPDNPVVESWRRKIGRGRVLSTKLNDTGAPACANNASKIAPMPAADTTPAGCNSIEFTIQKNAKGRKITSAVYWPIGPAIR